LLVRFGVYILSLGYIVDIEMYGEGAITATTTLTTTLASSLCMVIFGLKRLV